ncbi:mechanosensitive ion channel domain-containing protein [Okeania sp.]|uniref:mechanosensitive ion channel domain-containing protein n=1 Tax=Okeania sp. TaxID=3100323 RepID=UPI002B4B1F09|nr:mechanosensitive ion channel domain-containing protein [Okeania sp.]MEB3343007.1 mechanosensitive ion channel domain-containing protein [Okeania sp.]
MNFIQNNMAKFPKYIFRFALVLCIGLLSVFLLSPVQAEDVKIIKAPVILDSRILLEIEPLDNYTAQERAASITSTLESALADSIEQKIPPKVELQKKTPPKLKVTPSEQNVELTVDTALLVEVESDDNRLLVKVVPIEQNLELMVNSRLLMEVESEEEAKTLQEQLQQSLDKIWQERTANTKNTEMSEFELRIALKYLTIAFVITLLLQTGLVLLFRQVLRRKIKNPERRWYSLQLLVLVLLQVGVWATFIWYGVKLFPITEDWFYQVVEHLNKTFSSQMFQLGEEKISLNRILAIALTVVALWIGVSWFIRILKSRLLPLIEVERSHQDAIAFFAQYALLSIGTLLIINAGGVDFQSIAILIGALGIGIGFGLQNIVKDFICGLILIVVRPIKVGELVQVGEFQGLVQRIGTRTTDISNIERYIITIPNSRFIEGEVLNWNRSGITRVKAYVTIPYETDIDFVYRVLLAAAQVEHPDILRHPPPKVKFREYIEDGLQFRVVAFIRDPLKQPKVRTHLYNQIEIHLRKYGIDVARPQKDLTLKELDPEIYGWLRSQTSDEFRVISQETQFLEPPVIKEEYDWEAISNAMRGENGVSIKDRRFKFKLFKNVFLGSEAVEWLMVNERATREEAIMMGELMLQQEIIHHIFDEHRFKDEPLFYRFYNDEEVESNVES